MVRQWLSGMTLNRLSLRESRRQLKYRQGRAIHVWRASILEGLEGRVLLSGTPTLYTVNSTGSGSSGTGTSGTLPYVIGLANANTDTAGSLIEFDSTVFSSAKTITLTSTLDLSEADGPVSILGPGSGYVTVSGNNAFGVVSIASHVTATIDGLTISDGSSSASGGGIMNSGALTLTGTTISSNSAIDTGGGIFNSGTLTLTNTTISSNSAAEMGGGIANQGSVTLTDSVLSTNSSVTGGGIENESGSLSISGGFLLQNSATNNGGGIEDDGGTTTLSYSAIEEDSASIGAGIDISAGTMTIIGSTLAYNNASDEGGGIANSATLSIRNSTFAQNGATTGGGGIENAGTLSSVNVTIAGNDVGSSGTGGGLDVTGGTATLDNTIVATNTAGTGNSAPASDIALAAGVVSLTSAYNLIGTGGSGGLTAGTNGNHVDVANPGLGALGDNGGPTLTIALLQGSPAIDEGSSNISSVTVPTTDQRGALRGTLGVNAGSTVDIGAYEASSSFLVTSIADSLDAGTLPTAIEWADLSTNANPGNLSNAAPNTVVFDTSGLFSSAQTITLSNVIGTLPMTNTSTPEAIDGPGSNLLTISGGGAVQVVSVAPDVTVALSGLTIAGGSASSGGGITNAGNLTVTDLVITNNVASGSGGGVDNSGTIILNDTTVTRNQALGGSGGGIDNTSSITIIGSTISDNLVLYDNPSIQGNGGGIENGGTISITDSTISGNSVEEGIGGGIDNSSGSLTLTNATIAGNSAAGAGGISNDQNATVTAISTTISNNVASGNATSGGGLYVKGGSAALFDTIVALNTAEGGATASDITLGSGTVSTASAYNLIGMGGSGGLTQGTNGNQVGVAKPLLGPLGWYNNSASGSTQTIAVLPGSPAIGSGSLIISSINIPNTDQRGVTRPSDSTDIGAFQDRGFTLTALSGSTPQTAQINTPFAYPLEVNVASPFGDPVQGGIVAFTPASTSASATLSEGSATIAANGAAQVTATANAQSGSYTVSASTLGSTAPVAFALTNSPTVTPITYANVTGFAVVWGNEVASLVVPSSSGGLLLPPGRSTDIPWLGINVLQITLSQPESLGTSNITLHSARGLNYRVVGVSPTGSSYAVFLSRAISLADRVTITIRGSDITSFTGQINVLPGDFDDNGVVNHQDYLDVRAVDVGLGSPSTVIFADINGIGGVNNKDLLLIRQRVGTRLPRQENAAVTEDVETGTRMLPAVRIVRDSVGDFRRSISLFRV